MKYLAEQQSKWVISMCCTIAEVSVAMQEAEKDRCDQLGTTETKDPSEEAFEDGGRQSCEHENIVEGRGFVIAMTFTLMAHNTRVADTTVPDTRTCSHI